MTRLATRRQMLHNRNESQQKVKFFTYQACRPIFNRASGVPESAVMLQFGGAQRSAKSTCTLLSGSPCTFTARNPASAAKALTSAALK